MSINLDQIQKLRERTGLGMMDCKKALVETNGDIEKAVEILRKKGISVAEKRSGNKTSCGLIGSYIHAGARIGVIVEINCETDFVANTDALKQFAQDVSMHIAAMNPKFVSSDEVSAEFVEKEKEIYKELLVKENKPAAAIPGILEGKMKKLYSEVCLLNQAFIKNDKLSINDYLQEIIGKVGENIKVKRFSRFEIGV